jgi:predicted DNA-binding protein (MmcQ/YjbR family)
MDLESVRKFCLSFPGATEGLQWGDDLLVRVGNKIFVSVWLGSAPQRMTVKCTKERCAELLEVEGITRAPYVGRYDWVMLERLDLLHDNEIRELIAESYRNVMSKLPARVRQQVQEKNQSEATRRTEKKWKPQAQGVKHKGLV